MRTSTSAICRLLFALVLPCQPGVLHAQVPVHEEPRHRPVFQNKEIRILDVLLPPGDTTQYHLHHTPSVFIFFTETSTGSQLQGASAVTGRSVAGNILFENLAAPHTRVHRVWNPDKSVFHVMDVELLYNDSRFVEQPLNLPGLTPETDTPWVRTYRLNLLKGNDFSLRHKKHTFLLVALTTSVIQTKQSGKTKDQTLQPGGYLVTNRKQAFSFKNKSDHTLPFAVLEFPPH